MLPFYIDKALRESTEAEQLDLLFAAFVEILDQDKIDERQMDRALQILDFLSEQLRSDHASQFNLAFRKFYHALRRLVTEAKLDDTKNKITEARCAILKLTRQDFCFEFLRNCIDESSFARNELSERILALIGPQLLARMQPENLRIH